MNRLMGIIAIIIIILVVGLAYVSLTNRPKVTTTQSSTTLNTTTSSLPSTTIPYTSTISATTTINQTNVQNKTLTLGQVISALGTGWYSSAQHSYSPANVTYPNGTKVYVPGMGTANFSNTGQLLTTQWVQFQNADEASSYIESSFSSYFPNDTKPIKGIQGNATYIFYGGDAINKGQAASVIYAYDKAYGIIIFDHGTTFPMSAGQQLLASQLSDLNSS